MGLMKKQSFTLIELLVSVSIIALILPALFAIFFTMMRQQVVLMAYHDMIRQGNSIANNMKNIIHTRALRVTDSTDPGTAIDICPIITSPTPTGFQSLVLLDTEDNAIVFSQEGASPNRIASSSASKTYYLSTGGVIINNLSFTCYRIRDNTAPVVQVSYTVNKSALYRDVALPYTFTVRTRSN
ncbi:MAG: type II secretion system protein [Microgenomates group bacterium]